MTSEGHRTFLLITFDRKEIETWERCQSVRLIKAHQLICNMTYLGRFVTLTSGDLRSKVTNLPFKVKKHISRSGLTRGTQWCKNYSPNLCSSEVIDKKTFPLKNVILTFDDLWCTHY